MKIDLNKTVVQNLIALMNTRSNTPVVDGSFTFGNPTTITPGSGNENHNTEIVATWAGDDTVTGSTTVQYTRNTLVQNFPVGGVDVDVTYADIAGSLVHAKIAATLRLLPSELTFTDPGSPPAGQASADYVINPIANSKLYAPGAFTVHVHNTDPAPFTPAFLFDKAPYQADATNGDRFMGAAFFFDGYGDATKTPEQVYCDFLNGQVAGDIGESEGFTPDNVTISYFAADSAQGVWGILAQITPKAGTHFLASKFLLNHTTDQVISRTATTPPFFTAFPAAIMNIVTLDAFVVAVREHFKWPIGILGPYNSGNFTSTTLKSLGITIIPGASRCMINCSVITGERILNFQR